MRLKSYKRDLHTQKVKNKKSSISRHPYTILQKQIKSIKNTVNRYHICRPNKSKISNNGA